MYAMRVAAMPRCPVIHRSISSDARCTPRRQSRLSPEPASGISATFTTCAFRDVVQRDVQPRGDGGDLDDGGRANPREHRIAEPATRSRARSAFGSALSTAMTVNRSLKSRSR